MQQPNIQRELLRMQLVRDRQLANSAGTVVTIGNFDGLHLGHQRLIHQAQEKASQLGLPVVVLTFEPHPKEFFAPNATMPRLMRFTEKWMVLERWGVDYVCCLPFDKKLAVLSPEAFVKTMLVEKLNAKVVVVGLEFRFGVRRSGDVSQLKTLGEQYGFSTLAMEPSLYQGKRISSSRVRDALSVGDFETVKMLTGRDYCLTGRVAYGDQLGRQLGYPTANIHLHRKQVPLMGIFVVQVHGIDEKPLPAVASLGYRPTFGGKRVVLEVHIFNFNQIIYGRRVTVEFLQKIRDEIKFDEVGALIRQMDSDAAIAKGYFQLV